MNSTGSNLGGDLPTPENDMMVIDTNPSSNASVKTKRRKIDFGSKTLIARPIQQVVDEERVRRADDLEAASANAKIADLTDTITGLDKKGLDWSAFEKQRNKHRDIQTTLMSKVSRLCKYTYHPSALMQSRTKSFHEDLIREYDSISYDDPNLTWCPVMGEYMPKRMIKKTHIVNQKISESILADVLGFGQHTWNTRNGLVLCAPYQRLIDLGMAAIVPQIARRSGDREYYFVLLSEAQELGSLGVLVWGDDLEFRELEFLDDHLPDFKYLYLHFIIAVLRRHRLNEDTESAAMELESHVAVARKLWNTPVTRLTRPILYTFARNFGLLTRGQANKFWGITDDAGFFASLSKDEQKDAANKANSLGYAAVRMFSEKQENEQWGWDSRWLFVEDLGCECDWKSESEDEHEHEERGWKRSRDSGAESESEDGAEDEDENKGYKSWQLPKDDSRLGKKARM